MELLAGLALLVSTEQVATRVHQAPAVIRAYQGQVHRATRVSVGGQVHQVSTEQADTQASVAGQAHQVSTEQVVTRVSVVGQAHQASLVTQAPAVIRAYQGQVHRATRVSVGGQVHQVSTEQADTQASVAGQAHQASVAGLAHQEYLVGAEQVV